MYILIWRHWMEHYPSWCSWTVRQWQRQCGGRWNSTVRVTCEAFGKLVQVSICKQRHIPKYWQFLFKHNLYFLTKKANNKKKVCSVIPLILAQLCICMCSLHMSINALKRTENDILLLMVTTSRVWVGLVVGVKRDQLFNPEHSYSLFRIFLQECIRVLPA